MGKEAGVLIQVKTNWTIPQLDPQLAATLSADLKLKLGSYVILEMDTDKPYLHHKEHKKKYPPGKKK